MCLVKTNFPLLVLGPVKREKMKPFWVGKQRHKRIFYSEKNGTPDFAVHVLDLARRWCVGSKKRVFRIVSYHFHLDSSNIRVDWGGKFARLRWKQKIEMLLFCSFSVFALTLLGYWTVCPCTIWFIPWITSQWCRGLRQLEDPFCTLELLLLGCTKFQWATTAKT